MSTEKFVALVIAGALLTLIAMAIVGDLVTNQYKLQCLMSAATDTRALLCERIR